MIHKLFFVIGLVLLIAAAVLYHRRARIYSFCLHGRPGAEKRAEWIAGYLSQKLDLSVSQKARLHEIRREIMDKHATMCSEQQQLFNEAVLELEKEALDQERLNLLFQQKLDQVQQMHPYAVAKLAEFHGTLSRDQKQKLAALIRRHHEAVCH